MSGYGVKAQLEWLFRGEANGPLLAGCCLMLRELRLLGSYVPFAAVVSIRKRSFGTSELTGWRGFIAPVRVEMGYASFRSQGLGGISVSSIGHVVCQCLSAMR